MLVTLGRHALVKIPFLKSRNVPVFPPQVKDDDRALSLGSLTVPLMRLLASPELTMDQWFQLENSGSASRIYIKTVLRVSVCLTRDLGGPSEVRRLSVDQQPSVLNSQCLR